MPETPTSRLQLRRPLNDGSELVNVQTDLNQNADKIDLAAGFQPVTSTTRPSSPFSGKAIFETNTSRSFYSNGTAPASGSWVEIPNAAGTFGSTLKLAATAQLTIGADVNLFRNAANVLRTNDALIVDGAATLSSTLSVTDAATFNNSIAVTGGFTVTGNATVTGVFTARNRLIGTVNITPTSPNIPATVTVTFPQALAGSTFYGVAGAATSVPGSQVTGVGLMNESATGCQIYVTRTNTTTTGIRYIVEGF